MARQPTYTSALRGALAELDATPADAAAIRLAYGYAAALDKPGTDVARLGPALLACLTALRLTPAARAAATKGGTGASQPASPLDELRARRAARVDNTTAVDTAT